MKNLKKLTAVLLTLTLAAGVAGCGASKNSSTSSAQSSTTAETSAAGETSEQTEQTPADTTELQKVVIGTTGLDGSMTENAAVAQKEKFFEEELAKVGYYPEYQAFAQQGPAINEAFSSKAIDFAGYGDLPALTAKSNGIDIKVIATTNSNMTYSIVVANDLEISSVADLKGKKVVVGFGTAPYKFFSDLLEKNGLKLTDVEIVNSATDGPTMLPAKQADAFVTAAGPALLYQTNGIGKVFDVSDESGDLSSLFVLAGRTEYIEEHPEVAQALVTALQRAYEFAKENPDKVYEDLATQNLPAEIQKQVYPDTTFAAFNPEITDAAVKNAEGLQAFLKANNIIKNDVNVKEFLDASVYENAVK